MKSKENLWGAWAIFVGVLIAIILGVFQRSFLSSYNTGIYIVLATLGLIIGAVSTANDSRESITFLLAVIAIVIVSSEGQQRLAFLGEVGYSMATILNALLMMFVPATIIIALKTAFSVTSIN